MRSKGLDLPVLVPEWFSRLVSFRHVLGVAMVGSQYKNATQLFNGIEDDLEDTNWQLSKQRQGDNRGDCKHDALMHMYLNSLISCLAPNNSCLNVSCMANHISICNVDPYLQNVLISPCLICALLFCSKTVI